MLNIIRLTSGVLKKLQLADFAKLFLISSSSSLSSNFNSSSTLTQSDLKHCISAIVAAAAATTTPDKMSVHQHHNNFNSSDSNIENITTMSEKSMTSPSPSSHQSDINRSTSSADLTKVNDVKISVPSTESINNNSIKILLNEISKNKEQLCEITEMSSSTVQKEIDSIKYNCKSEMSSSSASASSKIHGDEGSSSMPSETTQSTCSTTSSSGKSCFTSSLSDILKFLELVGSLKHVKRTGWVLRDVKDCESISGHMYRMSIMTFLLDGTEGLDRTKCMELALVHDLAESLVGDITPFCGISKEEKKMRELKAMEDICKLIEPRGKRILELFLEYEENETSESKFVKDLDRLDMVLQAFEYEKRDDCVLKHQEFFDSTDGKFSHPFVVKLVNEIYSQRQTLAENLQQQRQQQDQQKQQQQQKNGFVTETVTVANGNVGNNNAEENVIQEKISS